MEKKEEEKEGSEAQGKSLVDKAQRISLELPYVGERQKEEQKSLGETSSGEVRKMALPS